MFDDTFDVQYLAKDIQPVWTSLNQPPAITQSGIGRTLLTPDPLFPYDLHPNAGFTPVITPLDVVLALIAKLGYEEVEPLPGTVQQVCDEWRIDYVAQVLYDNDAAQLGGAFADVTFQSRAFLFRYQSAAVICFRGTYPTAALQWLTDFAAQQVVYPGQERSKSKNAARVHRGFFSALGLPAVGDPAYPETMFTTIVRQLSELSARLVSEGKPPIERVYVTGHSLGAALATLFSFALKASWTDEKPLRATTATETGRTHRFRTFNAKNKSEGSAECVPKTLTPPSQHSATHFARAHKAASTTIPESPAAKVRAWQEEASKKLDAGGVYTYGSPRVGNDVFANEFDRLFQAVPVHRFINQADIVTHLPPPIASSNDDADPNIIFDYAHVDGLRFIDATQRALYCVNQDAPPTRWLALNILDHVPGDYVRHINAALVAQVRDVHTAKMYNRLRPPPGDGGAGGGVEAGGV